MTMTLKILSDIFSIMIISQLYHHGVVVSELVFIEIMMKGNLFIHFDFYSYFLYKL